MAARAATPRVADDIRRAYDKTMEFCVKYGHFSIAPGNMDGGLTTIEEKSMGAMVKSGTRPIRGVLKIAQAPKKQACTCWTPLPMKSWSRLTTRPRIRRICWI